MDKNDWSAAIKYLRDGSVVKCRDIVVSGIDNNVSDPYFQYVAGCFFLAENNIIQAVKYLALSVEGDPTLYDAKLALAQGYGMLGTVQSVGAARDILLDLHVLFPDSEVVLTLAARCCYMAGPKERATELFRKLAMAVNTGAAYAELAKNLEELNHVEEAVEAWKKAAELDPENYRRKLLDIERSHQEVNCDQKRNQIRKGAFPDTGLIKNDIRAAIIKYVAADLSGVPKFITKDTSFFSMGACFAKNTLQMIGRAGYKAAFLDVVDFMNTPLANRYYIKWLEEALPNGHLKDRFDEISQLSGMSREAVLGSLRSMDVFIYTLGASSNFFDRKTGEFVLPKPIWLTIKALKEKYISRSESVSESALNLSYALSFVRSVNKNANIVVVVAASPVLLTFERKSVIVADCLSKSALRLAAEEVVTSGAFDNLYYWPTFEVFRWLGPHIGAVYGTDDGAPWHVSQDLLETTMSCFLEIFGCS